jgi:sortase B
MIAYAGEQVRINNMIYHEGTALYMGIRDLVKATPEIIAGDTADEYDELHAKVIISEGGETAPAHINETPLVEIPTLHIDYKELSKLNAGAWLYSPGAMIDYPVMRAKDYGEYLYTLPDGSINANGSLFFDFNNAPDLSGRLTVIYGHSMKSGKMFGRLVGYNDQSFFERNPYVYLYTENGNYRIDLLYGCVVEAGEWRERAFMYEENIDSLISYASKNTTFKSGVETKPGDRFVALATCSYEFDDARYVLLGVLREEY